MSDNKNISIQDRGWNEMRSILDKEMPEKKRKRRFAFWIFLCGAVVMTSCLLMFVLWPQSHESLVTSNETAAIEMENSKKQNHITKDQEKPVLSESTVEVPDEAIKGHAEIENEFAHEQKTNDELAKVSLNKIDEPKTNLASTPSTKEQTPDYKSVTYLPNEDRSMPKVEEVSESNEGEAAVELEEPKDVLSDIELHDEKDEKDELGVQSLGPIKSADTENIERILLDPFKSIPTKNTRNIDSERTFTSLSAPLIHVKKDKYFMPYVFAGGNIQPNISGLGYGLGAGIGYGNENSSFYLESSYNRFSMNRSSDEADLSSAAPDLEDGEVIAVEDGASEGLGAVELPNSLPFNISSLSGLTTGVDELRLDLGFRKQLARNLSLDVGLAYSRLIDVRNETVEVELERSVENFAEGSLYKLNASQFDEIGAYSSYDITPHFGLDYRLSSSIYLNLSVNYGLINMIRNVDLQDFTNLDKDDDELYRRNLGFKIRYQF